MREQWREWMTPMIERAIDSGVTADMFCRGYTDAQGQEHAPILMPKRQQVRELFEQLLAQREAHKAVA